jgi:hypothetical protein
MFHVKNILLMNNAADVDSQHEFGLYFVFICISSSNQNSGIHFKILSELTL